MMACKTCGGCGRIRMPRGMSYGFYAFMGAGTPSEADGSKRMVCPGCDGSGRREETAACVATAREAYLRGMG